MPSSRVVSLLASSNCQPPATGSVCPFTSNSAKQEQAGESVHAAEERHSPSTADRASGKRAARAAIKQQQQQLSLTDSMALYDQKTRRLFKGCEGLTAGVSCMYQRLVDDPRTAHFFAGVDNSYLVKHMAVVVGNALLGRVMVCDPDNLREHHSRCMGMGLCPMHVDIMCEHLEAGLTSVGCPKQKIQAAQDVLQSYKEAFTPRGPSGQGTQAEV